jgi:hypothetical protein
MVLFVRKAILRSEYISYVGSFLTYTGEGSPSVFGGIGRFSLGSCVDLGLLMFDWKEIVMEKVVDNVQFVFVFFLLQVVGAESVV